MGQLLHGSARTTEAIRRAIQHSQASIASLAAQQNRGQMEETHFCPRCANGA